MNTPAAGTLPWCWQCKQLGNETWGETWPSVKRKTTAPSALSESTQMCFSYRHHQERTAPMKHQAVIAQLRNGSCEEGHDALHGCWVYTPSCTTIGQMYGATNNHTLGYLLCLAGITAWRRCSSSIQCSRKTSLGLHSLRHRTGRYERVPAAATLLWYNEYAWYGCLNTCAIMEVGPATGTLSWLLWLICTRLRK